jgi:hypoxanthine phosphoribosyltransferase
MNKGIAKILITEEEIDEITSRLAEEISRDYKDVSGRLVLVCILKGSILFTADLMKKLTVPVELECMKASSYGAGTTTSGKVNIQLDLARSDLSDCHLLVVEDIVDSGITLSSLTEHLSQRGAMSIKTVTMLDKPSRRRVEFTPDYCGRVIPDEFVIGYGLDYNERYRELPFIGVLSPDVYMGE